MEMSKTNDKLGPPEVPVKAGDTVAYTITARNTGTSDSYDNVITDILPVGMRAADPSSSVAVTVNGAPVAFTAAWNGPGGELTVTVGPGVSVPAGQALVVTYTATVDGNIGSGATLVNNAYAEYRSEQGAGRHVTRDDDSTGRNKASSRVRAPEVTSVKTALNTPAAIGDTVGYEIQMTVPAGTVMYSPQVTDIIDSDGIEYVAASSSLSRVSGPSPGPALGFIDGSQPAVDYDDPDPGATFTWLLNDVDNSAGSDFTFKLSFQCRITGLIDPAGSPTDPDNWTWWWTHGGDPTADNAAVDVAVVAWSDGVEPHGDTTPPVIQRVRQPHLDLDKENDSGGTALPGGTVGYTITVENSGSETSWRNVLVDTLPDYMTDTDPSPTVAAELDGNPLTPGTHFTASMTGNQLTVDFTAGSGGPISIPAGQTLVVTYTGTVSSQVGAGAVLTNSAVADYNSWSDSDGRSYTTPPATSSVTIHEASVAKGHDAAGGLSAIGEPFTYTVDVTVPAHTTIYNAIVTDDIADGLAVESYITYLDGNPQTVGTVLPAVLPFNGPATLTWDLGDFTNGTGSDQVLSLEMTVFIRNNYSGGAPVPGGTVFTNDARLDWDDADTGGTHHDDSDDSGNVTVAEPRLDLDKQNDASGPVAGGQAVNYTLTAVNNGNSASYQNVITDTLPDYMTDTDPSPTVAAELDGNPLTPGTHFTASMTGNQLTVDFTAGSGGPISIPAGQTLVVTYTGTVSSQVGAGAVLTNSAVADYNSWSDSDGRSYTTPPATSSVTIHEASVAKGHDAAGGLSAIGEPFTYTVDVTVPAHTTIYNARVTDFIADGLAVEFCATYLDGNPQAVGTLVPAAPFDGPATLTWDLGDFTNGTAAPVDLTLAIQVRVGQAYFDGSPVGAGDAFSNTAYLDWEDADTGGSTHGGSASASDVTVREPELSLAKRVDDAAPEAGDVVTYVIEVTNNGGWPAHYVVVSDTVDAALAYVGGSITGPGADDWGDPVLTWDIQAGLGRAIDPLETVVLSFRAEVKGGAASGQVVGNTAATSTYNGGQPDPYGRTYDPTSGSRDVILRAAELSLAKTVTAGDNPDWGNTVTYRLTVTNDGDADASGVGLRDTIPSPHFTYVNGSTSASWPGHTYTADPAGAPGPALDWDIGATLAPGETLVLTFDMLVEEWAAHGLQTNTGTAYGEDGTGTDLPEDTATADIDVRRHPGVSVEKALDDADGYVPVGGTLTYTITVTNTGNTGIPVVPLTDTYDPAYLGFVSASVAPDAATPGLLTWNDLGSLAPQGTHQVTLTFEALQPGSSPATDDTAAVDTEDEFGDETTDTSTNEDLTITDPRIGVEKELVHPDAFIPVGGTATYTITVSNDGDTDLTAPVSLTDTYDPAYLEFASATPPPSAVAAGTLTWDDLSGGAGLAPGDYAEVTVSFTLLRPGTTPATDNTVSASAQDEHGVPVDDEYTNEGLTVTNPRLEVEKMVKPGQEIPVRVQETAAFVITVTNTGDTAVPAPVSLTDDYDPAYLGFASATPPPSAVAAGTLTWDDLSGGAGLAVGESVSVEVEFTALQKGQTADTAAVSGAQDEHGDPVPPAESSASLDIGKIVGAPSWFLAEGSTGGGFDTWILLQNPEQGEAHVELTFTTLEGPRPPLHYTMGGESRFTVRIQDHVPDDFHVSTFIEADRPIVAERSMYWDKRFWGTTTVPGGPQPYEMRAGHANLGTPMVGTGEDGYDLPTNLFFPEGSTAPGFDTWILICNPNETAATVRIRLMNNAGPHDAGQVKVPARSRQTVRLGDLWPNQAEVATELISDIGIVAERSMYWDPNAPALQPYEMRGGHASPGTGELSQNWYIAEGSTGGGFDTYVFIQNPGPSRAEVNVTFLSTGGAVASKAVSMAPGTRATLRTQDYAPDNFFVATRVTSDQPVAAERAMYWDKRVAQGAVNMQEGHSATGVIHCGTLWTVPEGSTGGGFDSWVLIANPFPTQTRAEVVFMTESGPTAPVSIVIPGNSRYTIRVSDYVSDDFHISTTVEAEGPIVVERAMYWDKRVAAGIQPCEMMGGHSSVGIDP